MFDANGKYVSYQPKFGGPKLEIPTSPSVRAQQAAALQQDELGQINNRVWRAINSLEHDFGGSGKLQVRELKDSIGDLLSGSNQRIVKRKMLMTAVADAGRRGVGDEEEPEDVAELLGEESKLRELDEALGVNHSKMFRLEELETEQHQMVMALREKLLDSARELRKYKIEMRETGENGEKARVELAGVRVQLKQLEEKLSLERREREVEREKERKEARNQV